ncbi:DUF7079 family protein [Stutzerimonas chloritidismutans]|uniref:DUF7079 family protein n=1 Tax=Stutzerimonas chloritidismutans TaxID=203192 RepID=UPI003F5CD3CC
MGSVLTHDDKVRLWSALSDVFIDNEIDYPAIAREVAGYDRAAVKEAFFEEVAPVCYSNMQAPIPPIWTAFDSTRLADTIDSNQQARRTYRFHRMRHKVLVAYLRFRLRGEWSRIERELEGHDLQRTS